MIQQYEVVLKQKSRGVHLVTSEVLSQLPANLPRVGLMNLFLQHTSAALSINENADPDVRVDMNYIFNNLVRERDENYVHTFEGDDDMPAHAKSTLVGGKFNNTNNKWEIKFRYLARYLPLRIQELWWKSKGGRYCCRRVIVVLLMNTLGLLGECTMCICIFD